LANWAEAGRGERGGKDGDGDRGGELHADISLELLDGAWTGVSE
jgi:hypothetical protein